MHGRYDKWINILVGKLQGKRPDIEEISKKYGWRMLIGFIWLRIGTSFRFLL
jgi:hypothetical protein